MFKNYLNASLKKNEFNRLSNASTFTLLSNYFALSGKKLTDYNRINEWINL